MLLIMEKNCYYVEYKFFDLNVFNNNKKKNLPSNCETEINSACSIALIGVSSPLNIDEYFILSYDT